MNYQFPMPDENCVAILKDKQLKKPIEKCFAQIQEQSSLLTIDKISQLNQELLKILNQKLLKIVDSLREEMWQALQIKPEDSRETKLIKSQATKEVLKYIHEVTHWLQKFIENLFRETQQRIKEGLDQLSSEFKCFIRLTEGNYIYKPS